MKKQEKLNSYISNIYELEMKYVSLLRNSLICVYTRINISEFKLTIQLINSLILIHLHFKLNASPVTSSWIGKHIN